MMMKPILNSGRLWEEIGEGGRERKEICKSPLELRT